MKTVTLLQHLVDDYTRFVEFLPKNNSVRQSYMEANHCWSGVCHYVTMRYNLVVFDSYWTRRHVKHGMFWFATPSYTGYETSIICLNHRLNILKAELAHHKKWGWFARFFKPTVVGN